MYVWWDAIYRLSNEKRKKRICWTREYPSLYIYIETHFEYTIRGKPTTMVSKVFTIEDRSNLQIFQPPNLYGSHTLLIRLARRENGEDLHIIYHVPSFLHESLSLSLSPLPLPIWGPFNVTELPIPWFYISLPTFLQNSTIFLVIIIYT